MKHNIRTKKITSIIICFIMMFSLSMALDFSAKAVEIGGLESGKVYNLKNVGSGKYLNVYGGYDANGQNVIQWTKDGSVEQNFKLLYNSSADSYKFYAMCSSNGTNRVIDVARSSGSLVSGCNVDLWTPDDNDAQYWKIVYNGAGTYKIVLKYNTACALTAVGDSNGTASGKSSTSPGNVYLGSYTGSNYQLWTFEEVSPSRSIADGTYYLGNVGTGKYLDAENHYAYNGAFAVQNSLNESLQKWVVTYLNNGYYKIQPSGDTSLALAVYSADEYNANIMLYYADSSSSAQQWKIIKNSDGTYRISAKCSNFARNLDVQGASSDDEAYIMQMQYYGGTTQKWVFDKGNKTIRTNSSATANSGYNRNNAGIYARENSATPNTAYKDTGNNCTNFASQVLREAGLPTIPTNPTIFTSRTDIANWFYDSINVPNTWSITDYFYAHWSTGQGSHYRKAFQTIEYSTGEKAINDFDFLTRYLKAGDIIQYSAGDGITHSMVVQQDASLCNGLHKGTEPCGHLYQKEIYYAQQVNSSWGNYYDGHLWYFLNECINDRIIFIKIKKDI